MLSESARMNSAAEARFRVQAPNSRPRSITVIALDPEGDAAIRRLAATGWRHAAFLTTVSADIPLRDLAGREKNITDEVEATDLVVLVAAAGGRAHAAS